MSSRREPRSGGRFAGVVARLTGANLVLLVLSFITSPILARTLGPSGRGQVAAIFAVLSIAPWVTELGLTSFLSREHARRSHPLGVLLGSTMPITFVGALVAVTAAVPLGHALGRGRPDVTRFLELGLFLIPLATLPQMLYGVAVAEERWNTFMVVRVLSSAGTTVCIVTLTVLGALTVRTVAIIYIVWGLLGNTPFLAGLRGTWPWRFDRAVARAGLVFGTRSWLSTLANAGNIQLDQVLMAGLVSSRQLGFYALAVTLSTAASSLVGATATALIPRVAGGDSGLAARACRVTLLLVTVFDLAVALTSPLFVPILFGRAFNPMIPMLIILLAANLFAVPAQVLASALVAGGNPSATARATVAGLVVTVPGLLVLLPLAGGVGAAIVTLLSYGVTFSMVLAGATRTFGLPYRRLVLVTRSDLRWLWLRICRQPRVAT